MLNSEKYRLVNNDKCCECFKSLVKGVPVFLMALVLTLCLPQTVHAQISSTNPGEYAAVIAGNETINEVVKNQTKDMSKTAACQTAMSAEFTLMNSWEKKYNSYLKTAEGYASSLKAATQIYSEGVRIFMALDGIRKAVNNNPEGLAATVAMNNLYMETLTEMVSCYGTLKNAVAKGGSTNMLTGAERSKTLWQLEDNLTAFRKKLNLLYLSLRHYNMVDVWNHYTAGMIERDKGELARQSLDHWKRHVRETMLYR